MLDKDRMPKHVALIMDGNGRWARKRNVPRLVGHNSGMKSMKKIVYRAQDLGIEHVTVYAFSTENWKRSEEEVNGIFRILVKFAKRELNELIEKNVHVNVLGDISAVPEDARKSLMNTVEATKDNDGLKFNLCINYGGRDEVRRSVQDICQMVAEGRISPEDVTEDMIGRYLYTGKNNVPDPELIIRTSGEERLSNFLMWQSAYSEFVFVDDLWPDFTPDKFEKAIEVYQGRDRRFGGRK